MDKFSFDLPAEVQEAADQFQRLAAAEAHARKQYGLAVKRVVEGYLREAGIEIGCKVRHEYVQTSDLTVMQADLEVDADEMDEPKKYTILLTAKDRYGKKYYIPIYKAVKVGP